LAYFPHFHSFIAESKKRMSARNIPRMKNLSQSTFGKEAVPKKMERPQKMGQTPFSAGRFFGLNPVLRRQQKKMGPVPFFETVLFFKKVACPLFLPIFY